MILDDNKQKFLMHCISSDCKIASVDSDGTIGKTIQADYNTILQCHSIDNDIRVVLKPISSISNDEAKELYLILNFTSRISSINSLPHISVIKTRIKTFFNLKPEERGFSYHPVDVIRAYDYVRSIGYATEWNSISVEKQIENKWIILE